MVLGDSAVRLTEVGSRDGVQDKYTSLCVAGMAVPRSVYRPSVCLNGGKEPHNTIAAQQQPNATLVVIIRKE